MDFLDRRTFLAMLILLVAGNAAQAKDDGESDGDDDDDRAKGQGRGRGRGRGRENEDDDDEGRGNASRAVRAGEIMPLKTAMEKLLKVRNGRIIDVRYRKSDSGGAYEFKLKSASGRVSRITMNARTGAILEERR